MEQAAASLGPKPERARTGDSVCIITQGRVFGGTEAHTLGLIDALVTRGYSVEFVATRSPAYESAIQTKRLRNVRIIQTNLRGVMDAGSDVLSWIGLLRTIESRTVILPKGHNLACNLGFLFACLLKFRRRYVIEHLEADPIPPLPRKKWGGLLPRVSLWRTQEVLQRRGRERLVNHIVAVSAAVRDRLVNDWGYPKEKISVVRNGVDWIRFARSESGATAMREALGIPTQAFVVAIVGRLAAVKGCDLALRAFARARGNLAAVDPFLIVAGAGPERHELEGLARELGLEDRVRFLGFVDDTRPVYWASDTLLFASRREGLPIALLEGMAAGCVPIVTRIGGMPEAVDSADIGWVVEPESVTALADALMAAAETDKRRLDEMRCAAQKRIAADFDAARSYAKLMDALGL